MYIIALNKSMVLFQGVVLALLISAVVAEFTTDEDLSKQIVIPTLFLAIVAETAGVFTFAQTTRKFRSMSSYGQP